MNIAFTTCSEADSPGAAALCNSLVDRGWPGRVVVVQEASLPAWLPGGRAVHGATEVVAERADPSVPLGLRRVERALALLDEAGPGGVVAYFDADIVLKDTAAAILEWAGHGFACVMDVLPDLPATHPRRLAWAGILRGWGIAPRRMPDAYVNSGFFALRPASRPLLERWRDLGRLALRDGVSLASVKRDGGPHPSLRIPDQDLLNLAIMAGDDAISLGAPRDMDFGVEGRVMAHAAGDRKPWRRGPLSLALAGWPPNACDRAFWAHAGSPFAAFPPGVVRRRRLELRAALLLSRFYRRADA